MTRSHACRIIPTAFKRAVITAATLMFCLVPAWPHESELMERGGMERNWMERGWIYLVQFDRTNTDDNFVLVDPARIKNEKIYWDAINHICRPRRDCTIIFYLHITILRYKLGTTDYIAPDGSTIAGRARDSLIKNSLAMFHHFAESGENVLLFSCHTIENETCY